MWEGGEASTGAGGPTTDHRSCEPLYKMYWAYTTVLFSRISDSANELTLLGINTNTQKHASQQGSLPLLLSTITMHISLILLQVLLLMSQSKKESGPKCMCLWEDCSRLSEEITEHAPKDHVWRGPFQRWRIRDLSDKTLFEKMLLLASMCHHVSWHRRFGRQ